MQTKRHLLIWLVLIMSACSSNPNNMIPTVDRVDLVRFSGDWFVLGNIPTPIEKEAYNAKERYELPEGNRIETTFTFNKGSLNGPAKSYHPTGFVSEESNAVWGMQFLWPIKAEYRIVYLDKDYQFTIIGRSKRDYLWIMGREANVSTEKYTELLKLATDLGYDPSKVRKVPHCGIATTEPCPGAA